ncbi:unnamed protein product [Brassica oleracea]|uniref:(rape) hypothetical protein n=1 Tax=Brassica napus TaxID=3708 RepID=A0A816RJK5_BRANA|nr:unnamed protein product [Brassica napus]
MMMVKCFPQCITYSTMVVKEKVKFVVKQMNWPVKAVSLFPRVVGYSMDKRIVPWCNVIKALMSKEWIANCSETEHDRFKKCHKQRNDRAQVKNNLFCFLLKIMDS